MPETLQIIFWNFQKTWARLTLILFQWLKQVTKPRNWCIPSSWPDCYSGTGLWELLVGGAPGVTVLVERSASHCWCPSLPPQVKSLLERESRQRKTKARDGERTQICSSPYIQAYLRRHLGFSLKPDWVKFPSFVIVRVLTNSFFLPHSFHSQ